MKKSVNTILLLAIIVSIGFSQENDTRFCKNEFGVQAGLTTGLGYSYRHWFNRYGVQATGIVTSKHEVFISTGLSGLYTLKITPYQRFYLYLGNEYIYVNERYNTSSIDYWMYNIGIGPGFTFGRKVQFNLMFGYAAYFQKDVTSLLPTGEIGFYIPFNTLR